MSTHQQFTITTPGALNSSLVVTTTTVSSYLTVNFTKSGADTFTLNLFSDNDSTASNYTFTDTLGIVDAPYGAINYLFPQSTATTITMRICDNVFYVNNGTILMIVDDRFRTFTDFEIDANALEASTPTNSSNGCDSGNTMWTILLCILLIITTFSAGLLTALLVRERNKGKRLNQQ